MTEIEKIEWLQAWAIRCGKRIDQLENAMTDKLAKHSEYIIKRFVKSDFLIEKDIMEFQFRLEKLENNNRFSLYDGLGERIEKIEDALKMISTCLNPTLLD